MPDAYLCAMASKVRVRFAPSPTGGLHLGGVRTVLFNYLFAKKHGGSFILRIEDTDQSRYVDGAEQYIYDCLKWCGLEPDESPVHGGDFGPYRQSERKEIYHQYLQQLIDDGKAYLAFDTPEELELMRENLKASGSHSLQYDHHARSRMKNSLTLSPQEVQELLDKHVPYVVRLKVEPNEKIVLHDLIRGELEFDTSAVDDKVLMKADGMPTYHFAVVVDDFLMGITHAFRGEEWLPSAPIHVLLWKYLFGFDAMPKWAHLPLILKPDGNGKLSKRDGDRLGFPVYAMDWKDPASGEVTKGFKEIGFVAHAFNNMLAMLGWNAGTEQELFTMQELIDNFSLERVHKGGAKFDFEKAKWFNHEWIRRIEGEHLLPRVKNILGEAGIDTADDDARLTALIDTVKERCTLLNDFVPQLKYFYQAPQEIDTASVLPKWNEAKSDFFKAFVQKTEANATWHAADLESQFKELAAEKSIKPGELQLPLRIMLVGGKFGPDVFKIAENIGKFETISRIEAALKMLNVQP